MDADEIDIGFRLQRIEVVEIGDLRQDRHGDLELGALAPFLFVIERQSVLGRQVTRLGKIRHETQRRPAGGLNDRFLAGDEQARIARNLLMMKPATNAASSGSSTALVPTRLAITPPRSMSPAWRRPATLARAQSHVGDVVARGGCSDALGDFDRGGVIASLVGTRAVLDPEDAALVAGFIINKFRGDPSLFIAGKEAIVQATGWPALGFVPYFSESRYLPAEDALALDHKKERRQGAKLKIAVPILPQIANFDDLDPLEAEANVDLVRVHPGTALPGDIDLVILPARRRRLRD